MRYVNYRELQLDVLAWERKLPEFDAIAGVPRSGLLPASILALRRNIRLLSLPEVIRDPEDCLRLSWVRASNPAAKRPTGRRLLVVDDTSSCDVTLDYVLLQLTEASRFLDISYGVVYKARRDNKARYFHRVIPQPRLFEWNWFRHMYLRKAYLDIDGVVCEDWTGPPEQANDSAFESHVAHAKPLYLPQLPVRGLVTSRLEKYRAATEFWLRGHGVIYEHLHMSPYATPEARREANQHGQDKAVVYDLDREAELFVESSHKQAKTIFSRTGKPVLSIEKQAMLVR